MAKKKNPHSTLYNRKVNTREVKQRFLIVCEGTETEPNYFRRFRVPKNVQVYVKGVGKNPSQLVEYATQLKDKDPDYDRVWCVFDRDQKSWTLQDFNSALSSAKNNPSTTVHQLVIALRAVMRYSRKRSP